jgi:hypothetical protein
LATSALSRRRVMAVGLTASNFALGQAFTAYS